MDEQKKQRVIFTEKADLIFSEIIKKYALEESGPILDRKYTQGEETYVKIVRDATRALAQKLIPENKLIELLQTHLKIPKETAEKVVQDIKEKLLPLLLTYPNEKFEDPNFREEVSKKVFGDQGGALEMKNETKELIERIKTNKPIPAPQNTPPIPPEINLKKVAITDVDKNAENMKKEGQNITTKEKDVLPEKPANPPQNQGAKPDTYREPIE